MGRPRRVLVEGGVYHVYNRVARGELVFRDDAEAARLVGAIRQVTRQGGALRPGLVRDVELTSPRILYHPKVESRASHGLLVVGIAPRLSGGRLARPLWCRRSGGQEPGAHEDVDHPHGNRPR